MPPPPARTGRSFSRSSKTSDSPGAASAVAVGEIVGAHALAGVVRMRAYQPPAPSLRPPLRVLIDRDGGLTEVRVLSAAPHGRGLVLVALEGVRDREAAEALIGTRILVSAADLPPPADDEFYYHEVVGFAGEPT